MPSDLTIAITSVASGSFALLGVALTSRMARKRERAAFRAETALELAGMERIVWGNDWVELQAHIERQQSRLTIAEVRSDLVDSFGAISAACWHDLRAHVERTDGVPPGIRGDLVEARRQVHDALRSELLRDRRRGERGRRSAAAITAVDAALMDRRGPALLPLSSADLRCATAFGEVRRR